MKSNVKLIMAAATIAATLGAAVGAQPQEKTSEQSQPSRKASPEIDRLKFYLGEWDYTETYPKSAAYPNGGKNTGIYTSKLGPGGNSLVNTFHSQGPVGDFEGLLIYTWDPKGSVYKAYLFADNSPGVMVETGHFEGDALIVQLEFAARGTTMKLRNVTRLMAPDRLRSEEYMTVGDKPETLIVTVDAQRR